MGKLSDLDLQIKELRSCGETIIEIANTLAGMFYSQAAEDAPPEEKPKSLTLIPLDFISFTTMSSNCPAIP